MSFQDWIDIVVKHRAAQIEKALRDLVESEGLTEDDLRERAVMVTHPDGLVQVLLDGRPRIEWREGVSSESVAEEER